MLKLPAGGAVVVGASVTGGSVVVDGAAVVAVVPVVASRLNAGTAVVTVVDVVVAGRASGAVLASSARTWVFDDDEHETSVHNTITPTRARRDRVTAGR